MVGSDRAATAAASGRGNVLPHVPKDYRVVLPTLPSGEAMKSAVVLHCDISGRPYRIEHFRDPLKELGIIQEVSAIGAYQMSHVWLLNLRSGDAKKKLLEAGTLMIKDKICLVIDPTRQEVSVKLHWVAFDVTADAIRRTFNEYGDVKEVSTDRWKAAEFECADSLSRVVRLVLRDGVALERIPHQMRLGSGTVLVVVPGRAPLCLRCRNTGHIRRDCRVPRCSECRAFGHENVECTRSYARAIGRSTGDRDELLMDEDEAENAALSSETPAASLQKSGDAGQEEELETLQTPTATVMKEAACDSDAGDAAQCNATAQKPEETEIQGMEVDGNAPKRRHGEQLGTLEERPTAQLEPEWKAAGRKKKRVVSKQRSSSLSCDERPPL
ncbi:hypothetical protein HPB50_008061 [Hyalomma asiaticum]|uniref:Uncharacterized protein n=1 Tax=Hyalomma asiaticum TaxID=266040 RepID=A0ACB7SFR4_HYAAI|nr:hypothetical protein HPB50_008061 [Hyalomma asiaticum]